MDFNIKHWILVDKKPVEVDLMTWAKWFETPERVLKQEKIGKYFISTVFLGLDHSFRPNDKPVLFETMVFLFTSRESTDEQERYCTYDEAMAGHDKMVAKYKQIK